jgi:Xaa-Pro aminopeptidase
VSDAILLYGDSMRHPRVYWRTGFLAPDPVIYLEREGVGTLVVGSMELGRARIESRVKDIRTFEDFDFVEVRREHGEAAAYATVVEKLLADSGANRVVVEPDCPLWLARLLEARDVVVDTDDDLFADEMRRKTAAEQDMIARSQAAGQKGMAAAEAMLRAASVEDGLLVLDGAPLTSRRVIAAIETALLAEGCMADGTIVAGGPGGADPHVSDTGELRAGEPVIVDIFPVDKATRYFGDMTRTFVVGEPSETWKRMYDATRAAYEAALATVRAGVNGRDVHLAVCKTYFEAGFDTRVEGFRNPGAQAAFIHGTGHGLGLEVHEWPRLSDTNAILREGDVVTIEPGLYDPAIGGVRIEDTVTVTADGFRNLTDYPTDWRV